MIDIADGKAEFIRYLPAIAIAAYVAAALAIFPSFTPHADVTRPNAAAKADRLQVVASRADIEPACADQNWPNIDASCLKRAESKAAIGQVRLVTTDRRVN